jgi:uncharacterized membrane protein
MVMSSTPPIDHPKVVAAIQAAERRTSGEIRVVVSQAKTDDPITLAREEFERLGMTRTAARNGVLILLAPATRRFAVIGDQGVHEKCGDAFWTELADAMSGHFQRGDFTAGLTYGINQAGELLAHHFPRSPDDRNELPDDVTQHG